MSHTLHRADNSRMSILNRLRARWHYWLGIAQRSRGNSTYNKSAYEDAIAELTQAIEIDPTLARAHYARGVIYWRELSDYARAIRDFTRALELDARLADANLNRGLARVYGHAGTREEIIADFERYLTLSRDGFWRVEAHNQITRLRNSEP